MLYQNVAFGAGQAVGNWAVVKIQLNFNGSNTMACLHGCFELVLESLGQKSHSFRFEII